MAEKEKRKNGKKRTFGKGMVGLVLFSILFLIVSGLFSYLSLIRHGSQLFSKHGDIQLPEFVGLPSAFVTGREEYAGFRFEVIEDYNSDVAPGIIFDQVPGPSKTVKDNARITLYVSKGPRMVSVPDVIGMTYGEAMKAIQEAQLQVIRKTDTSGEKEQNTITAIDPEPGTVLEAGSSITIYVSSPVTSVTTKVPDVKGMDFTTAKATLIMMGLQVGEITEEYNPDVEPGTVIGQSIEPDTEVVNATLVDLVLATNIGTFERTFSFRLPYKDKDGQTSFTASFVDAEGNTVFTKTLCTKDTGVSLTRTGTLDEEMTLELNGRDYLKVLLNYQEGTFTVLEDYSAKNGFVTDRKTYSITVEYAEGGVVSYSASVLEGEDATIVITPNEGFVIDRVYDNDADVTGSVFNGTYVILGVNGNHTIRVTFKAEGT